MTVEEYAIIASVHQIQDAMNRNETVSVIGKLVYRKIRAAVKAETVRCIRAVCIHCANGHEPEVSNSGAFYHYFPEPKMLDEAVRCQATAIREGEEK